MIATFVNVIAVIAGSLLGLVFGKKITEKYKQVVFVGIGSVTLVLGITMTMKSEYILFIIISIVIGGFIGTALGIENFIYKIGEKLKSRLKSKNSLFATGYLQASMLFCVGAMTIVGSIQAGVENDYSLILIKSVMDGFMALMLTSIFGVGVLLSSLTILIYQGGLTLLAMALGAFIPEELIIEISAAGGILVMMIGYNLLNIKEVKTADFLPSLLVIALIMTVKIIIENVTAESVIEALGIFNNISFV